MRSLRLHKIILLCVVIVVVFGIARARPAALSHTALSASRAPLAFQALTRRNLAAIFSAFNPAIDLADENQLLRQELQEMQAQRDLYEAQARTLSEQLGLSPPAPRDSRLASVLATPGIAPYDILVIDQGSADGITQGDEVLYANSVPLGIVDEVSERTSRVKLYSTPGETLQVLIEPNSFLTTAEGQGGGMFRAELPKNASTTIGSAVTLPDSRGLLLGRVAQVESRDADSFQTILFSYPVNIFKIRFVGVATSR